MATLLPPVLPTERLTLREPRAQDADAIFAIYSDPLVARYLSAPPWQELDAAHAWLARMDGYHRDGSALQLLLERDADGRVIGSCTLFRFDAQSRRAEIGYAMASAHWGQGYMHEALCALVDYGFGVMDLRRIEADIDPRKRPSARSLERLGFTREGHLRERWEVAGEISDSDLYGLLRREWQRPA
jgi:RimJ/RimL family protein N-acetyltransferase